MDEPIRIGLAAKKAKVSVRTLHYAATAKQNPLWTTEVDTPLGKMRMTTLREVERWKARRNPNMKKS